MIKSFWKEETEILVFVILLTQSSFQAELKG